jgi:hypothetical protein
VVEYDLTDTEYLLWIHAKEKERAKRIPGASWDNSRGCWVFPRTRQVRDKLQAEFGKEARRRGADPKKNGTPTSLSGGRSPEEKELAARKLEIDQLRRRLQQLEGDLEQSRQAEAGARVEAEELQKMVSSLRLEMADLRRASEPEVVFTKLAKELAFQASGKSESFGPFLASQELGEFLPIRLQEEIEIALSGFLGVQLGSQELTDLIKVAKSKGNLDQEEIDLLYLVRNQRNAAAHPRKVKRTLRARAFLSLYAAAIIWPKIAK